MINLWNEVSNNLRKVGPKPVISWVSDKGRVELSGTTFLNAISKAGNYLIDGCGFDDSSSINVQLGNHWQAPVWKIAALVSGINLNQNSQNVFTFSQKNISGKKYIVSQDPFGMPAKGLPLDVENVSLEVRSYGDTFSPTYELENEVKNYYLDLASKSISEFEITGPYGLFCNGEPYQALGLQALVPALTQNPVVLIDGLFVEDAIVKGEKLTKIISL